LTTFFDGGLSINLLKFCVSSNCQAIHDLWLSILKKTVVSYYLCFVRQFLVENLTPEGIRRISDALRR
jgi:hypothetical protein